MVIYNVDVIDDDDSSTNYLESNKLLTLHYLQLLTIFSCYLTFSAPKPYLVDTITMYYKTGIKISLGWFVWDQLLPHHPCWSPIPGLKLASQNRPLIKNILMPAGGGARL